VDRRTVCTHLIRGEIFEHDCEECPSPDWT
jgi:hypothetical protein